MIVNLGLMVLCLNGGLTVLVLRHEVAALIMRKPLSAHERAHLAVGFWHVGSHAGLIALGH